MKDKIVLIPLLLLICAPLYSATPEILNGESRLLSDWLRLQQRLIRASKGVPHVAYSRHFAYTSIAVYEALIGGDASYKSLAGQLQDLRSLPKPVSGVKYCWLASANSAFANMFRSFYNGVNKSHLIDSLENTYNAMYEHTGYTEDEVNRGSAFGKSIAQAILVWAERDGYNKQHPVYQPLTGEGRWIATPPAYDLPAIPYWVENRMMTTCNVSLKEPLKFDKEKNSEFFKMVYEVYDTHKSLTEEQRNIAWFWDDSPNGKYFSVFGHWASILAQLIDEKKLSVMTGAEAFAKLSICQYHASIACWKGKYEHAVLRPVTYIQKYIDEGWKPVIETPPHPEYPAAHATMSSAAAVALTNVFGKNVAFTDHSYDDLGYKCRSFRSLEEAAHEAGLSRLYGGIHYRPSIDAGYLLGQSVAEDVLRKIEFRK
jgi:hypothetical protein